MQEMIGQPELNVPNGNFKRMEMDECVCAYVLIHTSEVQIVGGVDNDPHQGQVESSHFGSDIRFNTTMVQIMGTQQAIDSIDGLSLDLSPMNTHPLKNVRKKWSFVIAGSKGGYYLSNILMVFVVSIPL